MSTPALDLITKGELTVQGRISGASNAVLYCAVSYEGEEAFCVYKPVAGERPLWDFPDGTLAQREVAAYELSRATGWDLVPPTVLRDGPYGEGMCQLWIEADGSGSAPQLLALVEEEEPADGWKAIGLADVGRAVQRCWCTPTTPGCGASPSSTPSSTTATARAAIC